MIEIQDQDWYDDSGRARNSMIGKRSFLIISQALLIALLGVESLKQVDDYKDTPDNLWIVICRFVCAVFMHITLSDELRQSFETMKYALNHPWKFHSWASAFRVGLAQMTVIICLEIVQPLNP